MTDPFVPTPTPATPGIFESEPTPVTPIPATPIVSPTPVKPVPAKDPSGSGNDRWPSNTAWTETGDGTKYPKDATAIPTFAPNPGLFTTPQLVTLAATGPEVAIHYTTDGSEPTTSSTAYTGPFVLGTTTTVKAIATAPDQLSSPVVVAQYAISVLQPNPAPVADQTTAQKIGNEVAAGVQRAEVIAGGALNSADALAQTVEVEVANAKAALAHLETSSNAGAIGTIVNTAITRFSGVIATLEAAVGIHKASTANTADKK